MFKEEAYTVYLDEKELQQLKNTDFSEVPHLDHICDWFLLLAWTGSRFSDLEKITKADIDDEYITFRRQKTNTKSGHLENNRSRKWGKERSSMLAAMAHDPDSEIIDYGNCNVMHRNESAVVLKYLDFYHSSPD